MGIDVVAIIGKDEGYSLISSGGLLGLWVRIKDKGIVIKMPFYCSEGLQTKYRIPSILNGPMIKLNLREEGCRGVATVICDGDGNKLAPFYIDRGTACFAADKAVTVSVRRGDKIDILRYELVVDYKNKMVIVSTMYLVEMKSIIPKKYQKFLPAVEAAKLRSKLNENPELPTFCLF